MFVVCLLLIGWMTSVLAQESASPQAVQQILSQRLMAEMNQSINCQTLQITDKQKIMALETRVKELEEKYEPKADKPH